MYKIILAVVIILLPLFTPFAIADDSCQGVPKSDQEYAQMLAEQGDADAQYLLGAFYDDPGLRPSGKSRTYSGDAIKWFRKAAEQEHVKAQAWFCDRYFQTHGSPPEDDVNWCIKAAGHGHHSAQTILGYLYSHGIHFEQDDKQAYYWYKLAGHWGKYGLRDVQKRLSAEAIQEVENRVLGWKPVAPYDKPSPNGILDEEIGILHQRKIIPRNIAGVVCGGQSRDCKIAETCGDFVRIKCGDRDHTIASKVTKQVVSNCTKRLRECEMPKEWTCKPAEVTPPELEYVQNRDEIAGCTPQSDNSSKVAPILQNLAGVNLHVVLMSNEYNRIIKCHGREDECAPDLKEDPNGSEKKRLIRIYNEFPKALLPENVTALFAEKINTGLAENIKKQCLPFSIINNAPMGHCIDVTSEEEEISCARKRVSDFINNPRHVTFSVVIHLENENVQNENELLDEFKSFRNKINSRAQANNEGDQRIEGDQRLAIIKWELVRKNCVPTYLAPNTSFQETIPFSIGEEEIRQRIDKFVSTASMTLEWMHTNAGMHNFTCDSR
jgi:hypothetical protein